MIVWSKSRKIVIRDITIENTPPVPRTWSNLTPNEVHKLNIWKWTYALQSDGFDRYAACHLVFLRELYRMGRLGDG